MSSQSRDKRSIKSSLRVLSNSSANKPSSSSMNSVLSKLETVSVSKKLNIKSFIIIIIIINLFLRLYLLIDELIYKNRSMIIFINSDFSRKGGTFSGGEKFQGYSPSV